MSGNDTTGASLRTSLSVIWFGSFPVFPAMDLEGLHDLSAEELMGKKDSLEAEIRTQNDFLEAVGRLTLSL